MLNDVEATDKDIAAGGKNSVKDQNGVSDPYAIGASKRAVSSAQLLQKIERIKTIALKVASRCAPAARRSAARRGILATATLEDSPENCASSKDGVSARLAWHNGKPGCGIKQRNTIYMHTRLMLA